MLNEAHKIDIAIIGGGIVGLWSAYELLKQYPDAIIAVFEAEKYLGEHTTGRNSEVLHSGLYYEKSSLKHLHCLRGNQLWREYVTSKDMPFLDCGKIIVGTQGQQNSLEELYQRSLINEVIGVRWLSKSEVDCLKDVLNIDNGFFISSSAVLNASEALSYLTHDIEIRGGIILKSNTVKVLEWSSNKFILETVDGLVEAHSLVNTGGLFATDFRRQLGLQDYSNFYVKGNYLKLQKKLALNKLVYPIPPAHGLGLGVHLTLDTAGDQKFGPNTEIVEKVEYSLDESLRSTMLPSIKEVFKTVNEKDLLLGYAGVRPKIKKDETLIMDFIFQTSLQHGISGYYEFLGIESPGLTAAPSLARLLVENMRSH